MTLQEFFVGFAIGSTIGLILAAVITQKPFVEKVVAPYIIILVVTPMLALVPFLRVSLIRGVGMWPIIVAVALASGPMVLINAATGFRRTDLAKIALARSYGATTLQVFRKVRFPLALPMIIVGYMVGAIFGLLTAIGGEMVSASEQGGLGHQLIYFSSLIRMEQLRCGALDHRGSWSLDLLRVLLHRQALGQLGELAGGAQQEGSEGQDGGNTVHRGASRVASVVAGS